MGKYFLAGFENYLLVYTSFKILHELGSTFLLLARGLSAVQAAKKLSTPGVRQQLGVFSVGDGKARCHADIFPERFSIIITVYRQFPHEATKRSHGIFLKIQRLVGP